MVIASTLWLSSARAKHYAPSGVLLADYSFSLQSLANRYASRRILFGVHFICFSARIGDL
jgi:hypothetical protein